MKSTSKHTNRRSTADIAWNVTKLRGQGLSIPAIARRMNLTNDQVYDLIYDEPIKTNTSISLKGYRL